MKHIFLFALATVTIVYASAQSKTVQDYINKYKELAISEEIRSGVPAAITLAQGIIETNAGESDLVKKSNNHFGIKCKEEWTGDKVYHDDDARGECFRVYSTPEESYRDHSDFLRNRPYYTALFDLDPTDYEGWAKGLKKAGYATNPAYAKLLIKTIQENNLQDYTLIALQRQQQRETDFFASNNHPAPGSNAITVSDNANGKKETVAKVAQSVIAAPTYPTGVFEINNTQVVYAPAGTSLFALASNFNLEYRKLLEFNEMKNQDILDKDQLIYLSKKLKKGSKEFHIVNPNETIESIAQTEGVRLESIIEYNRIPKGAQPAAGEKIYLQGNAPSKPKLSAENNSIAVSALK